MLPPPSSSFAFTARCRLQNRPGMLGRLTTEVGNAGGDLRAIDIVRFEQGAIVRELTVHVGAAFEGEVDGGFEGASQHGPAIGAVAARIRLPGEGSVQMQVRNV